MKNTVRIDVRDYERAARTKEALTLGHYFAFTEEAKLGKKGRHERLGTPPERRIRVHPLDGGALELPGLVITSPRQRCAEVATIVSDRDLYRAEEDTVHLFVAAPGLESVAVELEVNGTVLSRREVELEDGVAIETYSTLLPGAYRASLESAGRALGAPAQFTVAEYRLAALSSRLLSHALERETEELSYELEVESYQVAFDGELQVSLVEAGRDVSSERVRPVTPGRYAGKLSMKGVGPLRLRLAAVDDAERIAEIAVPGSRARERDVTVVSELGAEFVFSMMPEPDAVPVRGGFLGRGDTLATALVAEDLVAEVWKLHVEKDIQSLHWILVDLTNGETLTRDCGDVRAGEELVVDADSRVATLVFGGIVDGRPFEGFSSFFRPTGLELSVDAPETVRPGTDLPIMLETRGASIVPVLVAVRDRRLTVSDRPSLGLGASMKRAIEDATEGMDEGFVDIEDTVLPIPVALDASTLAGGEIIFDMPVGAESMAAGGDGAVVELADTVAEPAPSYRAMILLSRGATGDGGEPSPPGPPSRSEFPQVLFYGLVPVEGQKKLEVPVGDSLGTFSVDVFALSGGDWTEASTSVTVDKPVRVDLDLPPAVHAGDKVSGTLRVATSSGRARVGLTRNGEPVTLDVPSEPVRTPVQLSVTAVAGTYSAWVEDPETGETDSVEQLVNEPGRFRSYAKELGLLISGEQVTLESADAISLRVLPTVQESFDCLVDATADYRHLCCEQTAAKILAATFMYLTSDTDTKKKRAETILRAGIEREQSMLREGSGFLMYPDYHQVNEKYSRLAVRYLWNLDRLHQISDVPRAIRDLAQHGVRLANAAAEAHGMRTEPVKVSTLEEAYSMASAARDRASVEAFLEKNLDFSKEDVRICDGTDRHRVANRAGLAYAGGALIALGHYERGVRIANQVTRQFNENGRLYSTVDSVAAICLMFELRRSGLVGDSARLRLNGQEMSIADAGAIHEGVESVEVLEGVAAVEILSLREDDWTNVELAFPLRVEFRDAEDAKVSRFSAGDRVDLTMTLPGGYRVGDLAHVNLPPSMSWIEGGGKVKLFTMDFAGKDEIRIPVVVTSTIESQQRFAICVRNMFEEERVTSPGLLSIRASV